MGVFPKRYLAIIVLPKRSRYVLVHKLQVINQGWKGLTKIIQQLTHQIMMLSCLSYLKLDFVFLFFKIPNIYLFVSIDIYIKQILLFMLLDVVDPLSRSHIYCKKNIKKIFM